MIKKILLLLFFCNTLQAIADTQVIALGVSANNELTIRGGIIDLVVGAATAGEDLDIYYAPTNSTISITTNSTSKKVLLSLNVNLPANLVIGAFVDLNSGGVRVNSGTSSSTIQYDLSTSGVEIISGINRAIILNAPIFFGAQASVLAGESVNITSIVATFTLTS
jgi:hypothetical protein